VKKQIENAKKIFEEAEMVQSEFFPAIRSTKSKKEKREVVAREWNVNSSSTEKVYTVKSIGSKWFCNCKHYVKSEGKKACKHIRAKKQELGLIKPDMSSYKSAIQKAIRRGDVGLLKLSFSTLWEKEQKWLCWRLTVLAGEESWKYTGWAGRFGFAENPSREDLWKLLYTMTVNPKDKDAEGLRITEARVRKRGLKLEDWVDKDKLPIIRDWIDVVNRLSEAYMDREKFWSSFIPPEDNEYARETVKTCKRRFYAGGMQDDRILMLTVAYLACVMRLEEPVLMDVPKEEEVEPAKAIPWFAIDMHTREGKIARNKIRKMFVDKEMGEYVSTQLWFYIESAKCDRLVKTSYWWPKALATWRFARGKSVEDVEKDWAEWGPKIRELVEKGWTIHGS
jgi:hypothetical protein